MLPIKLIASSSKCFPKSFGLTFTYTNVFTKPLVSQQNDQKKGLPYVIVCVHYIFQFGPKLCQNKLNAKIY